MTNLMAWLELLPDAVVITKHKHTRSVAESRMKFYC